jgi:hypothetical protein
VGNILTANVGGNYGWTFGYDNIYQVTNADQGSATNRAVDFSYDSVYNRGNETGSDTNGTAVFFCTWRRKSLGHRVHFC